METKVCKNCKETKPINQYHYKNITCRPCLRKRAKEKKVKTNPEKYLWSQSRYNATRSNMDFNIDVFDVIIPNTCPMLGTEIGFDIPGKWNRPSIDRIDNTKGYIKGNIHVISFGANKMKGDLTKDRLYNMATYILSILNKQ